MLGLLSAGAGAYTLFKDKPTSKDSELSKSSSSGSSVEPSNIRGDRGKEISVPPPGGSQTSGSQGEVGQQPSPAGPKLEKEDSQKYKEQFPSLRKKPKLDLKNKVDDIIRNNSKFANHRRPLINAEALVDKESYNGALEIYKRTKTRVPDEEIQEKIQENIDQIQNHIESDEEEVYRPDHYSGPPIPLGDLVRAIKDISESLGGTIAQGFSNPISLPLSPLDPGAIPGPPSLENLPPGPVSYQIFSPGPPLAPEDKLPLPSPGSLTGDGAGLSSVGGGTPEDVGAIGGTPGQASSQGRLEPPSAMDLPEDTFFSEEWEKFKDLPLVDRRTGESRRSGGDRRGGSASSNRKDRRQGEDRRKEDLFKLRDEYLREKEEEKKREKEEAISEAQESIDYDWPETPTRDELPPFLAPVVPKIELIPIRLPDPQDKTARPTEEIQPTTPSQEVQFEPPAVSEAPEKESVSLELPKIGLPDPEYQKAGEVTPEIPHLAPESTISEEPDEAPEIEVLDGGLEPLGEETEDKEGGGEESGGGPKEEEPRMIHGILELKPPEVDDAPFLTLTYDFDKIPHAFKLSKNYSIMEYSYYKYKPMLIKAQEFARRKMLKNALNYYRVIKSQNIPPELRKMINRNIKDITEFMEKYLMAKGG
ncbi:hypothetical protein [Leptospira borgpetersenii]|uniref:Uncharacterized protein n=1 Tax=Leptospira borgpetersenii serovar Javanica str. UI 09931 TaxID=1049767 RepID=A0AAV3J919_LEPBO|nr:hypothetical protein [Leptospira borgpetersenii]EKQ90404.1 hypothetical protein LEP1GSC101_2077 [Leptospira borgpetersenii str. UI 09149]EMN57972.1 hypothetical protein LEP1GSC090_0620 [Leptospira borgpetersenii serovar Javanica str. MK146]EPG56596.1 hypothetical protein LEP1GSC103_1188 [Leptospira borgpetersenii serovar Javanica str. UI 09931]MDQ7243675.1 hypothetical protein [Leptospira borgpetersenii]URD71384.1 hypothetical protein LIX26_05260 [Leptospira borgpetersenii]